MVSVAAVVVTFNRLEKLKTVIASIEAQTHQPEWLVIVDNASTDGTKEYLAGLGSSLELVNIRLETNTGGAGGFSTGMERGYELGADFVWIMDDDCYPTPTSLDKLIDGFDGAVEELGEDVPFSCSIVHFVDGSICEMNNAVPTWDWGRLLVKGQQNVMVRSASFVSVLIPRLSIERHGLPYSEYFIWFDDQEYTLRLTGVCPGVQVLDSVVVHDMGDNKGVNFGQINASNSWKFAYGIRNEASFRLHHQGLLQYLMFCARVLVVMRRGRVAGGLQRKMAGKLLQGISFNPKIRKPNSNVR